MHTVPPGVKCYSANIHLNRKENGLVGCYQTESRSQIQDFSIASQMP